MKEFFVNPTHGNCSDDNNGTSGHSCWETIPGLIGSSRSRLIGPGDKINLVSGHCFRIGRARLQPYYSGISGDAIVFDVYGGSKRPTLSTLVVLDNFIEVGANEWISPLDGPITRSFWVDANPMKASLSIEGLSQDREYYVNPQLQIRVFSKQDPSGSIEVLYKDHQYTILSRGAKHIQFNNLKVHGGEVAGLYCAENTESIHLDNVDMTRFRYGIKAVSGTLNKWVSDIKFSNGVISAEYQYGEHYLPDSDNIVVGDNVRFGPGAIDCAIINSKTGDSSHSCLSVHGRIQIPSVGNKFVGVTCTNKSSNYSRFLDIQGGIDGTIDTLIDGCVSVNDSVKSQIGGLRTAVKGLILTHMKPSPRTLTRHNFALQIGAYKDQQCRDVLLHDSVITNSKTESLSILKSKYSKDFGGIQVTGNKFLNQGGDDTPVLNIKTHGERLNVSYNVFDNRVDKPIINDGNRLSLSDFDRKTNSMNSASL